MFVILFKDWEEADYEMLKPRLTKIKVKQNLTFAEAQTYLNKYNNGLIVDAQLLDKMSKYIALGVANV